MEGCRRLLSWRLVEEREERHCWCLKPDRTGGQVWFVAMRSCELT